MGAQVNTSKKVNLTQLAQELGSLYGVPVGAIGFRRVEGRYIACLHAAITEAQLAAAIGAHIYQPEIAPVSVDLRSEATARLRAVPEGALSSGPWGPIIRDILVHLELKL